jgi:hypothetical protein
VIPNGCNSWPTASRRDKLSIIFGRKVSSRTPKCFQTRIADHRLGNPVIRSQYKDQSVKQYVRDHLLRTEETCYNTTDLGINKGLENLPEARADGPAHKRVHYDLQKESPPDCLYRILKSQ